MKLIVKSLVNWKILLLAFTLAGGLAFFSSVQVVHAQSDCIDPATGAACTPVPPPTCGVAGAPPCEPPPPPPSGCTAADPCTPVPPPPSKPEPTNTPRPRPTTKPTSTATYTATPTEMATETATSMATNTPQSIGKATTAPINAPAPNIPKPNLVTPKSQKKPWGWVTDIFSWLTNPVTYFPYGKDVYQVGNVTAIQGVDCVGGLCPDGTRNAITGSAITVFVPYYSDLFNEIKPPDSFIDIVEFFNQFFSQKYIPGELFFPKVVICQGVTGPYGCSDPVKANENFWHLAYGYPWSSRMVGLPEELISKAGTYQFTTYVNYKKETVPEFIYNNNYFTFTVNVAASTMMQALPTPTATIVPNDNVFSFNNTDFVLQNINQNCVQGCGGSNGYVIAGQPVEVYMYVGWTPYKNQGLKSIRPGDTAAVACMGITGQNGCAEPLPVESAPEGYKIPGWFEFGPYFNSMKTPWQQGYSLMRFTIPGEWIPSTGLYAITFYVNYNQQASPETIMNDNTKTIYLNAYKPLQGPTPIPTPTVSTSTDPFAFYDSVVALQDGKCVQGCSATPNDLIVGQPVDVFLRFKYSPNNDGVDQYAQPGASALIACQGQSGQNGCSNSLQVDPSPNVPQWFYNSPYGYLLQTQYNIAHFTIPGKWIHSEGTNDFTFYVNYGQQAAAETVMNNNVKAISLDAVNVIPTPTPSPTPVLMSSNDPFSFYDSVVVLQNGSCVQGCTLPQGDVTAGQPVDVYLRFKYAPFNDGVEHYSPPAASGLAACLGEIGQEGCSNPLQVDSQSIPPQWFMNSPYANLLQSQYSIAYFVIPGQWIPSMGLYGLTFYVNYQNQVLPMPEQNMSNNIKTIYLSAIAP